MGIEVDRRPQTASRVNHGVGEELTDEQHRQLDDRRFDTTVAEDPGHECTSATHARSPTS
jgi:hypothetical protein